MLRTVLVLLLLTIIPGSSGTVLGADGGVIRSYALVQDDATLRVRGKTIRLFGIYVPPTERGCATVIRPPACGSRTVRALELKIRGFVECLPQQAYSDASIGAICYIREGSILNPPVDLGAWLIELGLAVAGPDAPFEYGILEEIARTNGRGVWGFQVDNLFRQRR